MDNILLIVFLLGFSIFTYIFVVSILKNIHRVEINTKKRLDNILKEKSLIEEEIEKIRTKKKRFTKIKVSQKFRRDLVISGISLRPEEFMVMWIVIVIAPVLVMSILRLHVLSILAVALLCAFLPLIYVNMKRKKKINMFSKQLSDALLIISNSLKAGFTFEQAIINITKDLPDPISSEFGQVVREIDLGLTLEESLTSLTKRMQSTDLELLVTTVVIQKEIGGNLADIIETISDTIKERVNIKNTIRTLSAQGRISGIVVAMIPVAIILVVTLLNPDYIMPLFFYYFWFYFIRYCLKFRNYWLFSNKKNC